MNIAFLYPGELHHCSGGYRYNRCLLAALKNRDLGLTHLSIDHTSPSQLAAYLEQQQVSVVIEDSLAYSEFIPLNQNLKKLPAISVTGLIHNVHSYLNQTANSLEEEKRYFDTLDSVICVSNIINSMVSDLSSQSPPSLVLNPGRADSIHEDANSPINTEFPDPLKLICVAHFLPHKRQLELIQALARANELNWQLTLVGSLNLDPNYTQRVQQEIRRQRLTSQITCAGQLTQRDLACLYPQHHVFIQASTFESFGLVLLEAYQFGLPVISFANGEPKHLIKHGTTGFWHANLSHLPQALSKISAQNIYQNMSEACRQAYLAWPSWSTQAKQLENFLRASLQS